MYEMRKSDGEIREFASGYAGTKKCFLCGQYFKENDRCCLVVPPFEMKKKYKKLQNNLLVHTDEWEEFMVGVETPEDFEKKVSKHRVPKKKEFTEEEKFRIECFCKACDSVRFYIRYDKPTGVKKQERGTTCYFEYNVYSDKISYGDRRKGGLFDSFFKREYEAKIYNLMHEYMGDGKSKDYSAVKDISNVMDKVNEDMKKYGF